MSRNEGTFAEGSRVTKHE